MPEREENEEAVDWGTFIQRLGPRVMFTYGVGSSIGLFFRMYQAGLAYGLSTPPGVLASVLGGIAGGYYIRNDIRQLHLLPQLEGYAPVENDHDDRAGAPGDVTEEDDWTSTDEEEDERHLREMNNIRRRATLDD